MAAPRKPRDRKKHKLTADYLRSILSYNRKTGRLHWKRDNRGSNPKKGNFAGGYRNDGYYYVGIDGALYYSHRVIWAIITGAWPKDRIDHKSGDPSDNRWRNLRQATHAQNLHNTSRHKNNKTGYKGVQQIKGCSRFYARLRVNNVVHRLGSFPTAEQASAAYKKAAIKFHREFCRF